jgi:peptidyl-prolyl cis-trans isomerase A (cyclophilin A)
MSRRTVLAATAALTGWPALAEPPATDVRVDIQTGAGLIVADLYLSQAPITVGNFMHYVAARRFDGASFYRSARTEGAPTEGLIEGGVRNNPAKVFRQIAHESTLVTGLTHKDGTLSMARGAPGTATGDFFICIGDSAASFDASPGGSGDTAGYAAFGQVVQGMEVVRAILAMPTTGRARDPAMQGQMLAPPVPIVKVRRSV